MNQKTRAKASSLFLLELIIAILFFSIASAVCVQIFVKSHLLSSDAQELNMAVSECSGVAEMICASKDSDDTIRLLNEAYPDGIMNMPDQMTCPVGEDLIFCIYYDDNMKVCGENSSSYQMTVTLSQDGSLLSGVIDMSASNGEESIYSLEAVHHIQEVLYE